LFQPASLTGGPFPTDALTVAASNQITGRQVNLPATPCPPSFAGSVCGQVNLLNNLDGFSVNPRLMVCFSAPVDTTTLASGITLISLAKPYPITAINQVFYDPASNCAFAKPDQVLAQQSRYLLAISDSVTDSQGAKLAQSPDFKTCLNKGSDSYCQSLSQAVNSVNSKITGKLVAASVFTTMSATTWLDKARQFVDATELPIILPAGLVTTFSISNLSKMTW